MISVILAFAVVCVSIYLYVRLNNVSRETYLKEDGVPVLNPDEVFPKNKILSMPGRDQIAHNYFKSRGNKHYVSVGFMGRVYNPVDHEVVKHILIKDFDYFKNRPSDYDEDIDPLNAHSLFNTKDETWKNWRVKLTPTFTTGKMKMMFPLIAKCAEPMTSMFDDYVKSKEPLDIKEMVSCYATDGIATCAFGLEFNSLKNPDVEFRVYGKKYMTEIARMDTQIPKYARLLPRSWQARFSPNYEFFKETTRYFIDTIKKTIEYRETNNVVRNDFVHMLIQIKNRGTVSEDDKLATNEVTKQKVTMNQLAAHAFLFYLGGFETSATLMTFMCYELSNHQDIQDKLREDIRANIKKHGGLTYEAIQDMSYLNKVINETLRLHPPVPKLLRMCNKDYTVPDTNAILRKGTFVNINVSAFQRDPEFYPNPEEFNPENFDKEAGNRPMAAFMPFGDGPRNCIGLRFGGMQARVGMATLLKDFRIRLHSKTPQPIAYNPVQFVTTPMGGVYLELERVN